MQQAHKNLGLITYNTDMRYITYSNTLFRIAFFLSEKELRKNLHILKDYLFNFGYVAPKPQCPMFTEEKWLNFSRVQCNKAYMINVKRILKYKDTFSMAQEKEN